MSEGEKIIAKLRVQNEELVKTCKEQEVQLWSLKNELESQAQKLEFSQREATELKGSFLRMKKHNLDLIAELDDVKEQNVHLFDRIQEMVPKAELEHLKELEVHHSASQHFDDLPPRPQAEETEEKVDGEEEVSMRDLVAAYTPRPHWKKLRGEVTETCGIFINKDSTHDAVEKLGQGIKKLISQVKMIQGTLEKDKDDEAKSLSDIMVKDKYITCLGMGEEVPKYLKFNGQVRNRKMNKRDAERVVREIWAHKSQADASKGSSKRVSMEDFFFEYCRKKFGSFQNMIAEFSYNVLSVLKNNTHDADCDLFLKVLSGELSEDVYFDQLKQMEECKNLAIHEDKARHSGTSSGMANKHEFLKAVQVTFNKTTKQMEDLTAALDQAFGDRASSFAIKDLFAEDREFSQNEFAEEFRSQIIKEREQHLLALKQLIHTLQDDDGYFLLDRFRLGLRQIDPIKKKGDIDAYLYRGCRKVEGTDLPDKENADFFLQNLFKGVCKPGVLK